MKHTLLRHAGAFLLSVVLAVAFLLAGACLPQGPIDANVHASASAMEAEGYYPMMADRSFASTLDTTTDALILLESKVTSIRQWDTILTNPLYLHEEDPDPEAPKLFEYSLDPHGQVGKYYVQYWMGFRPVIRLLLSFLDYYQILRYTAVVFFLLLSAVVCSMADRLGGKAAFLFAVSMMTVRPHVIAVSLQFSCCFLIAFAAMLLVPAIHRQTRWEALFFLELGILTQYFDFYTTPVITFCLPMTYLYLLQVRDHRPAGLKTIAANALHWSAGYGFMWLSKLILTSVLTGADGVGTGFASFFARIGVEKTEGLESYYSPLAALRSVAVSLYSDRKGLLLLLAAGAVCLVYLLVLFLRGKHHPKDLLQHGQLIVLAALPLVWFMAAAQPTANHHWFQYRSIMASFFAGFAYLQLVLQPVQSPK